MTAQERVMRTMKYAFIVSVLLFIFVTIRVPSKAAHHPAQSVELIVIVLALTNLAVGWARTTDSETPEQSESCSASESMGVSEHPQLRIDRIVRVVCRRPAHAWKLSTTCRTPLRLCLAGSLFLEPRCPARNREFDRHKVRL